MMRKGFTLVELMVAIILFLLTIGATTSLAVSLINQEKRSLATQGLIDNSSYFLEYGGRFLRMAQEDDGDCIAAGTNYDASGVSSIRFLDYENHCREFLLDSQEIKEKVSTDDTAANLGTAVGITAPNAEINSLSFTVSGDSIDHQPRVTVNFSLQDKNLTEVSMTVETTISQRNLNL